MKDSTLVLKDAGEMTADGVCTVDGAERVIDLGNAYLEGKLVLNLADVKISAGNEVYKIKLETSKFSAFYSGPKYTEVYWIELDASEYDADDIAELVNGECGHPIRKNKGFRYVRLSVEMTGTSPAISFESYIDRDID